MRFVRREIPLPPRLVMLNGLTPPAIMGEDALWTHIDEYRGRSPKIKTSKVGITHTSVVSALVFSLSRRGESGGAQGAAGEFSARSPHIDGPYADYSPIEALIDAIFRSDVAMSHYHDATSLSLNSEYLFTSPNTTRASAPTEIVGRGENMALSISILASPLGDRRRYPLLAYDLVILDSASKSATNRKYRCKN